MGSSPLVSTITKRHPFGCFFVLTRVGENPSFCFAKRRKNTDLQSKRRCLAAEVFCFIRHRRITRAPSSPPTKRELLSTKSSLFVYPSRRLGISSPREVRCISSAPAGLYLITRQRAFCLRLDDIQHFVLMIYRNRLRMICKAHALIYLRKCDIINSPKIRNLPPFSNNTIGENECALF